MCLSPVVRKKNGSPATYLAMVGFERVEIVITHRRNIKMLPNEPVKTPKVID